MEVEEEPAPTAKKESKPKRKPHKKETKEDNRTCGRRHHRTNPKEVTVNNLFQSQLWI